MEHRSIKEIAAEVRQTLKREFPNAEFSVTVKHFSMGCSMTVSLMKSPFQIMKEAGKNYVQLNQFQFLDTCGSNYCDSLTPEGFGFMKKVTAVALKEHWSDSDSTTDYHNTNFYLHLQIGKWDKPYQRSYLEDPGVDPNSGISNGCHA